MIAIPFAILALAAGVYLLIQVKHYGFGGLYKALAWLVILLSITCISFCVARGGMHMKHHHQCSQMSGQCDMRSGDACPHMEGGKCEMSGGRCNMGSGDMNHCSMHGDMSHSCPMMKDSTGKGRSCHMGAEAHADSSSHK